MAMTIILRLLVLVVIIAAAGLWAGAGVDTRPKYRDEQTLIGGTLWSQLIIPIGLVISKSIKEKLDTFVHAYFLLSGVLFCTVTGVVLLVGEYKSVMRFRRHRGSNTQVRLKPILVNYDRIYLGIGILCLIAGVLTFANFIILVV